MRVAVRWALWIVAALVGVPLLLVALLLAAANTDPGRRLIESAASRFTGGMIHLEGLNGRFPDELRFQRLQVADATGVWLTVENGVVDWSPTRLLSHEARIDTLTAKEVKVARLPKSKASPRSSGTGSLPVRVVLGTLRIDRLDLAEPVMGTAAVLQVEGAATLATLEQGTVRLNARRLDTPATYAVNATVDPARIDVKVVASEPDHGLISGLAKLPDQGPVAIKLHLDGPREAAALVADITAGPLRAAANGTIDLTHQAASLSATADAPAMRIGTDLAWQSLHLDTKLDGPVAALNATGTLRIAKLAAGGAAIDTLKADLSGDMGALTLHLQADGTHIPGPHPDILANAPLLLTAHVRLDQPDRPVTFSLRHPVLEADGSAHTAGPIQAAVTVRAADLAPLASLGGLDLRGHTELRLNAEPAGERTAISLDGVIGISGGQAPIPALIGDAAHLHLDGTLAGQDVTVSQLQLDGKTINLSVDGAYVKQNLAFNWRAALSDLTVLQPSLSGTLDGDGQVAGTLQNISATANLISEIATKGYKSGRMTAHLEAHGLPSQPSVTVNAAGELLDAPITLALSADQRDGVIHATINAADWKTLHAKGGLSLAQGASLPTGSLRFEMTRLADLSPLLNMPLGGSATLALNADAQQAELDFKVENAALPGSTEVAKGSVQATVTNLATDPVLNGRVNLANAQIGGIGMSVNLTAHGPQDALAVEAAVTAPDLQGAPAKLDLAGTVNATAHTLALASLRAGWRDQELRLLAPARLRYSPDVAVDKLRLGLGSAELTAAGTVSPQLDLTATLRNLPADIAALVAPNMAADGVINADARLTGSPSMPQGTVKLTASRVRLRSGPGQSLPPADLVADATLAGTSARVDARLTAGTSRLTLSGTAPLQPTGSMDLVAGGAVDLRLLDPILSIQGRQVRGQVTLNAAISGTTAAPRVSGTARLANGDVQDFSLGAHISAIAAELTAEGDVIRLTRLTGKAGAGTIGGGGTIGLGGDMPVDLRVTADNARPVSSDLLTAVIDADLTLRGALRGDLAAAGRVHVRRADVRVPEKLPHGVAILPVRYPGQRGAAASTAPALKPPDISLDLILDAPQQVFIRGRGVDAELGGRVHITGTAANPSPDGGLTLRRGTLSVIGQTLTFTEGAVTFTGAGLSNPSIRLVASVTTSTLVATLTVSGSAKDPKITLSSVPDAPQDEILAQLLFNSTTSKLSPLQLAQIAAALASLSGASSGIGDPLESLRNAFGLDRLSVGSGSAGSPTLEAGRYVARGVYVGAKQTVSGGSQATVQVDLGKGLRLETTAGTGSASATGTTGASQGASVGLTYRFEY